MWQSMHATYVACASITHRAIRKNEKKVKGFMEKKILSIHILIYINFNIFAKKASKGSISDFQLHRECVNTFITLWIWKITKTSIQIIKFLKRFIFTY